MKLHKKTFLSIKLVVKESWETAIVYGLAKDEDKIW